MSRQFNQKRYLDMNVYEAARERVRRIINMFDHFSVSFSGGKDSTVLLQIVREIAAEEGRGPVRVIHIDEECIPLEVEAYVRRIAQEPDIALEWYTIPVRHRNAASRKDPWWYPWDPDCPDLWVREKPPEGIDLPGFPTQPRLARFSVPDSVGLFFTEYQQESAVQFLGLRAAESLRRWQAIANRPGSEINYLVKNMKTKVAVPTFKGQLYFAYPIYDWTVRDVWRAITDFGWDYTEAYNRLSAAGVSLYSQRVAPPFGEEPIQALHQFKTAYPEIWEKMAVRVDGANTAAMYAKTELYLFGKDPDIGEDVDAWKAYVTKLIELQEDPQARTAAAVQLRQMINAHYKATTEPILATSPHPDTGLSWSKIAKLASKGNLKGRSTVAAPSSHTSPAYARMRRNYDAEYRRHILKRNSAARGVQGATDQPDRVDAPGPAVLELV